MKRNWLFIPDIDRLEESLALAGEFGAAFEYDDFFDPQVYTDDAEVERRINAYLQTGRDLSADTMHGVFLDVKQTSADPDMRAHARKLMGRSLDIALRLGVHGIVFHSDYYGGMTLVGYDAPWIQATSECFRDLCKAYPGIDIYLENTVEPDPQLLVQVARNLQDVSNFHLCLDYAHAALTDTSLRRWVQEMGPYVAHIHVNDHDYSCDMHAACGTQSLDFELFAFLVDTYIPDATVLIEVSSLEKARTSLEYLRTVQARPQQAAVQRADGYSAEQLFDVLETNLALSREKNKTALLDTILTKSMDLADCDAGTLYELRDDELHFMIMKTRSLGIDRGGDGQAIDLPPVKMNPANVCAFSAMNACTTNIPDVYEDHDEFDFSGPRRYDEMTGYVTRSMLTVPLMDDDNRVLGVMQLINAQDSSGNLRPFDERQERLISVLAAQAAITMRHMAYLAEIRAQLWSFTEALAEAIDQRTPYNGSHTRKVAQYSELIARRINECHDEGLEDDCFDQARIDQLVMAALLHDIGKMVVPTAVMNKPTRLASRLEDIEGRFELIRAKMRIAFLEESLTEQDYERKRSQLDEVLQLVQDVNTAGFVDAETRARIDEAAALRWRDADGELPYLTDDELEALRVVKGTLTDDERAIMQGHVTMTERILKNVRFNEDFIDAPVFAAQHHEYLNGTGYPRGLTAEELPLESRILTVADVCDALLADDRPYKKALPREKGFAILHSMAADGQIEERLVTYLEESLP